MTLLAIGQLIADRYELTHRIAVGGMGEVWEAEDNRLGRAVAVKILRPELSGDDEFRHRFRVEAQTVASLDHPGIAHVHDYGEELDGSRRTAYLVMELVRGEPLSAVVARGPLHPDDALRIVEQAAWALHAAHERGFVHRDVKPGNILVGEDGRVKLTDFGIAKAANAAPVTRSGMVMGTAHYIAPEQATGGEAGPAGDVYSLGIVTYECLAGHRPFRGESAVDVAAMQVRDAPPPLPPAVPANVRALVETVLVKDPARRYRTGEEYAEAVAAVRRGDAAPRPSGVFDAVGDPGGAAVGTGGAGEGDGRGPSRLRRRWSRVAGGSAGAGPVEAPRSPVVGSPVQPPAAPVPPPAPPASTVPPAPPAPPVPPAGRPSADSGAHRAVEGGAHRAGEPGTYRVTTTGAHRIVDAGAHRAAGANRGGTGAHPAATPGTPPSPATGLPDTRAPGRPGGTGGYPVSGPAQASGAHAAAGSGVRRPPEVGERPEPPPARAVPDSASGAYRAAEPVLPLDPFDSPSGGQRRPPESLVPPAYPTVRSAPPGGRAGAGRRSRPDQPAPLNVRPRSSVGRLFLLILFVLLTVAAVVVGGLVVSRGLGGDGVLGMTGMTRDTTATHPALALGRGSVTGREDIPARRAAHGAPLVAVVDGRDVR